MVTRRTLIQQGSLAGLGTALVGAPAVASAMARKSSHASSVIASVASRLAPTSEHLIDDPSIRALAMRAIDSARAAGASYADARITRTVRQTFNFELTEDHEVLAIGVRALYNGAWGFCAGPFLEPGEAERLARNAVAQAKTNAKGTSEPIELGVVSVVTGSWIMPVRIDPFTVSPEEKIEFSLAWRELAMRSKRLAKCETLFMRFIRQERAVATTDGSYFTQTTYSAMGSYVLGAFDKKVLARRLSAAGKGWDLFLDADIPGQLPGLIDEAYEMATTPVRPPKIGRYDVVFDAETAAALVDKTIGVATELDRIVGYEANASGTSYLGPDPLASLGTYTFNSPLLHVSADRSAPGTLAAVKWDDEGVAPQPYTLVDKGIVTNYQTTREQAAWIAPWYAGQNRSVQSNGCAGADSALSISMQRPPNLILAPGAEQTNFADLVASVKTGYAIQRAEIQVDHQARNGSGAWGLVREIVNGRVGAIVGNIGFLFNTREFWKNLSAVGGPKSAEWYGQSREKGQPVQTFEHSVCGVPLHVKNVAIIDASKKA